MKIVVMSDSHGSYANLDKIVRRHSDADMFIHLGDGERELHTLFMKSPELEEKFHCCKGNCDFMNVIEIMQRTEIIDLPYGHRIFATHGDKFSVKSGTGRLMLEAKRFQADIVLYGHTHCRDNHYEDGIYILNPSSIYNPRDGKPAGYAVISVSEKGILIKEMDV